MLDFSLLLWNLETPISGTYFCQSSLNPGQKLTGKMREIFFLWIYRHVKQLSILLGYFLHLDLNFSSSTIRQSDHLAFPVILRHEIP